jgi:hypothetical protein
MYSIIMHSTDFLLQQIHFLQKVLLRRELEARLLSAPANGYAAKRRPQKQFVPHRASASSAYLHFSPVSRLSMLFTQMLLVIIA